MVTHKDQRDDVQLIPDWSLDMQALIPTRMASRTGAVPASTHPRPGQLPEPARQLRDSEPKKFGVTCISRWPIGDKPFPELAVSRLTVSGRVSWFLALKNQATPEGLMPRWDGKDGKKKGVEMSWWARFKWTHPYTREGNGRGTGSESASRRFESDCNRR